MFDPFPHQAAAISDTLKGFMDFPKQVLVAPTGVGKTVMFCHIALAFKTGWKMQTIKGNWAQSLCYPKDAWGKDESTAPARTLILVHREELAKQALEKLSHFPLTATLEKAESYGDPYADVVVASVQTMQRRKENWKPWHFGLIVVDECHHTLADSYLEVLRYFDRHAKVLGATATPDRGDMRNLGEYFNNVAHEISFVDCVKKGFLSRISVRTVPLKIDLQGLALKAGDYKDTDLDAKISPWLGQLADVIATYAPDRKTLVFLPLIKTSLDFAGACIARGLDARHVDGQCEDRAEVLQWFAQPGPRVLCNAMLLTEGFDQPDVDCIAVWRPTRSRPLFAQMCGRGTRTAPGKKDLLLLDLLWLHETHRLVCRPTQLLAKNAATAERMQKRFDEESTKNGDGETLDLLETFNTAEHARETALREELAKKAKRKAKTIDLIDYLATIGGADLLDFEPVSKWEADPVSDGQKTTLQKFGVDPALISCKGQASKVLDAMFKRSELNLASPKQIHWLKRFHVPNPEDKTRAWAGAYLTTRFGKKTP